MPCHATGANQSALLGCHEFQPCGHAEIWLRANVGVAVQFLPGQQQFRGRAQLYRGSGPARLAAKFGAFHGADPRWLFVVGHGQRLGAL